MIVEVECVGIGGVAGVGLLSPIRVFDAKWDGCYSLRMVASSIRESMDSCSTDLMTKTEVVKRRRRAMETHMRLR